jgi:hypothetical protein
MITAINAKVKVIFPEQISLTNRVNAKLVNCGPSNLVSQSTAKMTVTQSRYVVISNLFIQNLVSPFSSIEFTIDGVTNPGSIRTTDSFTIIIFYTEGEDEVS